MNKTPDELREEIYLDVVKANYYGLVNVSVRVGKTRIGIRAIDDLYRLPNPDSLQKFRALWITDNTKSRDKDLPEEFKVAGYEHLLEHVTFVCYESLKNITGFFDVIIADECQKFTVKNALNLLSKVISWKYMLALTGTVPKSPIKKYLLGKLGLKEISKVTTDEAVEAQVVSEYRINVLKFSLDDTEKRFKDNTRTELQQYNALSYYIQSAAFEGKDVSGAVEQRTRLLYNSKARKRLLLKIFSEPKLENYRGIFFMSFKKDAEKLKHFYHSTSTDEHYNKFQEEKINKLALVKKGSSAHTYHNIDFLVISQLTRDFVGSTTQSWGRGLMYRKNAIVQVYMFCAKDTVEEQWLQSALRNVDPNKINIRYV